MSLDKFNTTPSPLQVVEKVNDVIDALGTGSFDGYWEAGESVEVGDMRYVEGRDNVGYILECVQAGTTGTTQPTISPDDVGPEETSAINLNDCEGVLSIEKGGTDATTAEEACANIRALPLSGGVMTGSIRTAGDIIETLTDDLYINFSGGSQYATGASLTLYGNEHSNSPGQFVLKAGNFPLIGKTDGTLAWAGNKVATSNSSGHLVLPDGSEFWIA